MDAAALATPKRDYGQDARMFLRRALAVHTVDEVGHELGQTLAQSLGASRTVLIVSDQVGEVRLIGAPPGASLSGADTAFEKLADRTGPLRRSDLGAGDDSLRKLFELLSGEVLLPLRHRGALIAVVVVGATRRPVGEQEMFFLRRIGHEASVAVANAHLYTERQGKAATRRQVSLATAMQDALFPEERPVRRGQMTLRGLFRPAAECGGDFWTWEDLGAGKLLVAVGDVTGKGVAAAMLAATAKGVSTAMRASRGSDLDPAEFLAALNGAMYRAARTRWLMTCFAVVVDCDSGELRCANAGHHFAYVIKGGGGLAQIVVRGDALGAKPDASFASERRELAAGDAILLYTDGIIDAAAPGREAFGEKRLRRLLERGRGGIVAGGLPEALLFEVEQHTGGGRMVDDITLVELCRIDTGHVELRPETAA